jgi:hypothetical protein
MYAIYCMRPSESIKYSTWGVRSQEWNSKELTGARTSGGACGLIRWYARNLTWALMWLTVPEMVLSFGTWNKVLHGCRQLVPWGVGLSPATSATPILSCQHVMMGTLRKLPAQAERKVGMTSSHHGPYAQGYTRATMASTKSSDIVIWSESQKAGLSSDWGLQLDLMKLESLVIAYQQWRGEYVPGPCTHRPSSHGSWVYLKMVTI